MSQTSMPTQLFDASASSTAPSSTSDLSGIALIWRYFRLPRGEEPTKRNGRQLRYCLTCTSAEPQSEYHATNAISHLKHKHPHVHSRYVAQTNELPASMPARSSVASFFGNPPATVVLRESFNHHEYTRGMVGLVTRRRLPFSAVEWPEFRQIAAAINPACEDLLLTSRTTAMRRVEATFQLYQTRLREKLNLSVSLIHLSTDLWTSPSRRAVLAICAQWVDPDLGLQKALLGLLERPNSHSGAAQADLILQMVDHYGISNIGYHIGDNATSNDTCLESLYEKLLAQKVDNGDPQVRLYVCSSQPSLY